MKILAGIVTYNPDVTRLKENLDAVLEQCENIVIFDNGSKNNAEIKNLINKFNARINLIEKKENLGIAEALKSIMQYAVGNSYSWVLTLDQDSVVMPNLVDKYLKCVNIDGVGALTCNIVDRNFKIYENRNSETQDVDFCITSGCFMSVDAYKKTCGYDSAMFIDKVDFDICYSLRDKGFRIIKIDFDGLLHEVGHGKEICLFGIKKTVFNHPAWRRYYMARNAIYLSRKHCCSENRFVALFRELGRLSIVVLFEKDKVRKVIKTVQGLMDGFSVKRLT